MNHWVYIVLICKRKNNNTGETPVSKLSDVKFMYSDSQGISRVANYLLLDVYLASHLRSCVPHLVLTLTEVITYQWTHLQGAKVIELGCCRCINHVATHNTSVVLIYFPLYSTHYFLGTLDCSDIPKQLLLIMLPDKKKS